MKNVTILSSLLLLPVVTSAQSLQTWLPNFVTFLSSVVIPVLLGVGFLVFIINVLRYFVAESGNEQGREKAKNTAIFSIAGFVIIIIFWGAINLLAGSIGLNDGNNTQPKSDYVDFDQT